MLVPLYKYLQDEASTTPFFPPPGAKMETGFNRDLLEDLMIEMQARLYLYRLTPETGKCSQSERLTPRCTRSEICGEGQERSLVRSRILFEVET